MPRKSHYTVKEASKKLGISRQAVMIAIKSGRLKAKTKPVKKMVLQIPTNSIDSFEVSLSHKERGLNS